MKATPARLLLLTLVLALALSSAAPAEVKEIAVGPGGAVFKLHQGLYGELFPNGHAVAPDNGVLALDVLRADDGERLLVPETESWTAETPATLLYETSADVVYLLWQGYFNIHPLLYLTSFDGAQWGEVIEITGSAFSSKGHPQLVITRDLGLSLKTEALLPQPDRAVMHVVWWEQGVIGSYKRYAALVFDAGIYLGWNPVHNLTSFLPEKGDGVAVDPNVEHALRIQPGAHSSAVVIGFLNHETGHLVTMEVETLPRELSRLAEQVATLVMELGVTGLSTAELAEQARTAVLELGVEFHPGSLNYIADQVRAMILEELGDATNGDLSAFTEKLGVRIIHIGVRFKANGLDSVDPTKIVEIGQTALGGRPYHHLKVSILSDREPPEVGGEATLYLSRSGRDVLVAWDEEGMVRYRETDGDGWREVQTIELREDLDRDTVYQILADRILNK